MYKVWLKEEMQHSRQEFMPIEYRTHGAGGGGDSQALVRRQRN